MKKKKYITPNVEIISTEMQQNLLAGSGIKSSMDSDESEWEVVDNSDPSLSGRSATGLSKSYNSDWETER
ncbi:hypothetical protein JCM15640A_06910 [Hoylesella timonensis 4401737 = DSM 22865 = JCM 15640]|uniref:hypothetical protein n=1 Tax=Hoylesella timonensis TaxID=386414 RepID=UPI0003F6834D|nr:hypothetical protein [Hoylesella timonensis]